MIEAAQKVGRAVIKGTGAEGVNFGINNGAAAGQIIFHLHMHIIPRNVGDGLKSWEQQEYREGEMESIAEAIRVTIRDIIKA